MGLPHIIQTVTFHIHTHTHTNINIPVAVPFVPRYTAAAVAS